MLHTMFRRNRQLVPEKKVFEGFYNICAWRSYRSSNQDGTNKLSFSLPMAFIGRADSEETMFKHCGRRRR